MKYVSLSVERMSLPHPLLMPPPQSTAKPNTNPAAYPAIAGNPAAFAQWSNALTNPATYLQMMRLGMDPNSYARTGSQAISPASLIDYQP